MKLKNCLSMTLSIFLLTSIFYQNLLLAQQQNNVPTAEDIAVVDGLVTNMINTIKTNTTSHITTKKSEYKTNIDNKFKIRNIDETEEGKNLINKLVNEFAKKIDGNPDIEVDEGALKKDYHSTILSTPNDGRHKKVNEIVKHETYKRNKVIDGIFNKKNENIENEFKQLESKLEEKIINSIVDEIEEIHKKKLKEMYKALDNKYEEELKKDKKEFIDLVNKSSLSKEEKKDAIDNYNKDLTNLEKQFEESKKHRNYDIDTSKIEEGVKKSIAEKKKADTNKSYVDLKAEFLKERIEGTCTTEDTEDGKCIKGINKEIEEEKIKASKSMDEEREKIKNSRKEFLQKLEDDIKKREEELKRLESLSEEERKKEEERIKKEKEKAEFEKKLKEFEQENAKDYIVNDTVLKGLLHCSKPVTIVQEGEGSIKYCKKWTAEFNKLKFLNGKVKTIKDLELKVFCKDYDTKFISGNNVSISDNIATSSISIKENIYYECDEHKELEEKQKSLLKNLANNPLDVYYSDVYLKGRNVLLQRFFRNWCWELCTYNHNNDYDQQKCNKCVIDDINRAFNALKSNIRIIDNNCIWSTENIHTCNDKFCDHLIYDVCWGCISGWRRCGYRNWFWCANWDSCCWKTPRLGGRGSECWYNGYGRYAHASYNWFDDLTQTTRGACIKDVQIKLSSAIKHHSYTYTINTCNEVDVKDNIKNDLLNELYDPNFITFQ